MTEKKVTIKPRGRKSPSPSNPEPAPAVVDVNSDAPDASRAEPLRAQPGPRFQFFLIDSGWNTTCARIIRDNLDMITRFQNDDALYILTREQSVELLKRHPHMIGKDPVLLARDLKAGQGQNSQDYHGFHLNLGILWEPNKAAEGLRSFLNFLSNHRHSNNIETDIKAQLHRDGIQGAIEVLRQGGEAMIGS